MQHRIKRFGPGINEGWFNKDSSSTSNSSGEELTDINDIGVYKHDEDLKDGVTGVLTRVSTGEEMYVYLPEEEDPTDWDLPRWNEHVCRAAQINGLNCVYFPSQQLVVKIVK